jgi:hypothetical protein
MKHKKIVGCRFSEILVRACAKVQVVEVFINGGLAHCATAQCMGAWVKNGLMDGHLG